MSGRPFPPVKLPRSGYTPQRGAERGAAPRRTPPTVGRRQLVDDGGYITPTYVRVGSGGSLDTLAQLCQKTSQVDAAGPAETMRKRARAKYLSAQLATALAELRTPLEKSYRNSVYCCGVMTQEGRTIKASYCGNRWCSVCNRTRTARAMNKYLPILQNWSRKQLVTLTRKNVPAAALRATIKEMLKDVREISRGMNRTDGIKLVTLRKLECTHNAATDEYHPHFHFIVQTEAAARLLVKRWTDRRPDVTDAKAQDVRSCANDTLREVFKYFTKLITKVNGAARVNVPALDVIFRSMAGLRVYQPMGFTVPKELPDEDADELNPDVGTPAFTRLGERVRWEWQQKQTDWIDTETGECLTNYQPAAKFVALVAEITPTLPPEARAVAPLNAELDKAQRLDEDQLREAMRVKMAMLDRNRQVDPDPLPVLQYKIRDIFNVSAERAAELAAAVAPAAQLELL